jgi:ATP-binding protein involved in chromosome partitioning
LKIWLILHQKLPDNKYYLLERRRKNLAEDLGVPFLGGIPIVQSIREAGDYGRPAAMQTASAVENISMKSLVMLYKKR